MIHMIWIIWQNILFFWKSFKEQIADMYEKVTEVLKRQYTYFENVNLFYNGNWLSIRSIV